MKNYSLFLPSGSLTATYGDIGAGHYYLYCGTPEKALPFLLQAALRTPQVGDTHFFLTGVALAAGDRELADAALENVRRIQPRHPELPELEILLKSSMVKP